MKSKSRQSPASEPEQRFLAMGPLPYLPGRVPLFSHAVALQEVSPRSQGDPLSPKSHIAIPEVAIISVDCLREASRHLHKKIFQGKNSALHMNQPTRQQMGSKTTQSRCM